MYCFNYLKSTISFRHNLIQEFKLGHQDFKSVSLLSFLCWSVLSTCVGRMVPKVPRLTSLSYRILCLLLVSKAEYFTSLKQFVLLRSKFVFVAIWFWVEEGKLGMEKFDTAKYWHLQSELLRAVLKIHLWMQFPHNGVSTYNIVKTVVWIWRYIMIWWEGNKGEQHQLVLTSVIVPHHQQRKFGLLPPVFRGCRQELNFLMRGNFSFLKNWD